MEEGESGGGAAGGAVGWVVWGGGELGENRDSLFSFFLDQTNKHKNHF